MIAPETWAGNLLETISATRKRMKGATIQTGIPEIPPGFNSRTCKNEPPDSASPGSNKI